MTDLAAYHYDLPPELVAQEPSPERGGTRLLVLDRDGPVRGLRPFDDLPGLLEPGDLLVCNDSRVLPARLWTRRADTGGRVEVLLVRPHDTVPGAWLAMARPGRRLRPGQRLALTAPGAEEPVGPQLTVLDKDATGQVTVAADGDGDCARLAEQYGDIPLPPYIHRDPEAADAARHRERDRRRYQTVYARQATDGGGSVAAPTAGLHFTDAMLARLAAREVGLARVTLHVGPGTFRSPTSEQVARRRLHAERFVMPASTWSAVADCRRRGGRVFAVGTTSLRVLETVRRLGLDDAARAGDTRDVGAGQELPVFAGRADADGTGWRVAGTTRLFISPPDTVAAADGLVTNFHLPGSSPLMLVAAFAGEEAWRAAYDEAVSSRLAFYSYGDAMLIRPAREDRS